MSKIKHWTNEFANEPVKHGHWIEVGEGYTWGGTHIVEYECSLCKEIVNWHKYPYCPPLWSKDGWW